MSQKTSVGLVVLTKLPGMGGVVAVLQVRGTFNHEKMARESWPGACQVTCHGGAEEGEDTIKTLEREFEEECGIRFSDIAPYFRSAMTELIRKDDDKPVVTYGLLIEDPSFLKVLKLNTSTGGIHLLQREQLNELIDLRTIDKVRGVTDRRTIAMFPDEIAAVRMAFDILAPDAGAEAP
ncbi:MAG: NUDIX domain-containing protein [Patescibacteria group bacterium]